MSSSDAAFLAEVVSPQSISLPCRNLLNGVVRLRISVGDVVVLREDGMVPTQWPLARVVKVHTGCDGVVRVITLKTRDGTYTRPITKVVLFMPCE